MIFDPRASPGPGVLFILILIFTRHQHVRPERWLKFQYVRVRNCGAAAALLPGDFNDHTSLGIDGKRAADGLPRCEFQVGGVPRLDLQNAERSVLTNTKAIQLDESSVIPSKRVLPARNPEIQIHGDECVIQNGISSVDEPEASALATVFEHGGSPPNAGSWIGHAASVGHVVMVETILAYDPPQLLLPAVEKLCKSGLIPSREEWLGFYFE
jgi:hypothetical protein